MKQFHSKAALITAQVRSAVDAVVDGDWSDVNSIAVLIKQEQTAAERKVRFFDIYSRPQGISAQAGYVIEGFGWVKAA